MVESEYRRVIFEEKSDVVAYALYRDEPEGAFTSDSSLSTNRPRQEIFFGRAGYGNSHQPWRETKASRLGSCDKELLR